MNSFRPIEKLMQERRKLLQAEPALSPLQRETPSWGRWSAREVLAHIAAWERGAEHRKQLEGVPGS